MTDLLQGVTEDTPLWDEDDALDEAAEKASAKAKPAAKQAAAKPAAKPATEAIVPKVKKAVVKAAKVGAAAAKVDKALLPYVCTGHTSAGNRAEHIA